MGPLVYMQSIVEWTVVVLWMIAHKNLKKHNTALFNFQAKLRGEIKKSVLFSFENKGVSFLSLLKSVKCSPTKKWLTGKLKSRKGL